MKLKEIICEHKIDLIEAPDCRAKTLLFQILVKKRPPLVIKIHGGAFTLSYVYASRTLKRRWEYLLQYMTVRRADFLTSPSRSMIQMLTRESMVLRNRNNIRVLPNFIDTNKIKPSLSGYDSKPTVLFIGSNEYRKGPQVLMKAIPYVLDILPCTQFIFIGSGFKKQSMAQEKNVVFINQQGRKSLYEYYRKAGVCFHQFGKISLMLVWKQWLLAKQLWLAAWEVWQR